MPFIYEADGSNKNSQPPRIENPKRPNNKPLTKEQFRFRIRMFFIAIISILGWLHFEEAYSYPLSNVIYPIIIMLYIEFFMFKSVISKKGNECDCWKNIVKHLDNSSI